MHGILSDFIYWLNSNILLSYILSYSNCIAVPQKSFFCHTFSRNLSLFSVLKEWKQFKQYKLPWYFDVISLKNINSFFTAR